MTVIPLGRALPHGSSHLPADSVGHVVVCLLGVAPRRDWPFHPSVARRLVSVPLILASRRTGVTRYAALWSPDFPLCDRCGTATVWLASRRYFTLSPALSQGRGCLAAKMHRVVIEGFASGIGMPAGDAEERHRRHHLR